MAKKTTTELLMKRPKGFKMDPYLVSSQPYELYHITRRFKKKGISVTADQIRAYMKDKKIGRSRQKMYRVIEGI